MNTHRVCRSSSVLTIAAVMLLIGSAGAATIAVYNTHDNLAGSLREAIGPGSVGGDTILFQIPTSDPGYDAATNTFTITLTGGELAINKDLTIDGGGQKIVIQRSSVSGTPLFRIFNIVTGTVVTFTGLTVANGSENGAAGIANNGNLTLRNCTLYGNNAGTSPGGGILNTGILQVSKCTFTANSAAGGGAIKNSGSTTIDNSTIFLNKGTHGGVESDGGTVRVRNTIIAGNNSGDVSGAFLSDGYNFIGKVDGSSGFGNAGSHDQVGTVAAPADPQLGPLQDNGGPTLTMRPLAGSPVIDQGISGGVTTDQRGFPRPVDQPGIANVGDGSDIGAVETGLPQTGPTFTVTNTSGNYAGSCGNDVCSFVDALTVSNATAGNNTINFAPGVIGTIPTTFANGLGITNSVTINGPGARALNIAWPGGGFGNGGRVFLISGSNVAISGLTISGGYVISTVPGGAGIYHSSGVLALTDCTIANNHSVNITYNAGGIYNDSGATLTLLRCALMNNSAVSLGGGVYNDGTFFATNCTFSNNTASNGGGIASRFNGGTATMTLRNCTITNCAASSTSSTSGDGGGGVWAEGGAAQHHVGNTILAGNTSGSGVNPDVSGQYTSDGHNAIGNMSLATGFGLSTHDRFGNPLLGSFGNNGGPTDTVSLQSASTARDNGDDNLAPPTDQRGYLRSGTSDIGAFEFGGSLPVLKITSIARLANGHISLQGLGISNTVHTIQAASDPNAGSFSFLGSATSSAAGVVLYDDAGAVGLTRRFYRLTFP